MYTHETEIRVRYGETDQMGYLYYGRYAEYYEVGRGDALRALGMTYRDMEEEDQVLMPVMSMQMRYVRPAKYDDLIKIRTTLRELPVDKCVFFTELFNEEGKLINAGEVRLVYVSSLERKRVQAPERMLEKLRPYFEKE